MPIIQYWHTTDIPRPIRTLFATFSELNPDLPHRIFDEANADEFIAVNFSAREAAAFRACAIPAMHADYSRYCAVLALGGVYSDADHRCIAPLGTLVEKTVNGGLFAKRNGNVVTCVLFVQIAPLAVSQATEQRGNARRRAQEYRKKLDESRKKLKESRHRLDELHRAKDVQERGH